MEASRRSHIWRDIVLFFAAVIVTTLFFAVWRAYYKTAYPICFEEAVLRESENQNLPPSLVFAVIRTESGFRPEARSSVGARGLMQLTEETFDWVRWRTGKSGDEYGDLDDPERNIEYGAALLRLLLDEFGSTENALCAYHAGWGSAKSWLEHPDYSADGETIDYIPFGDTRRYVQKVLDTQKLYKSFYGLN